MPLQTVPLAINDSTVDHPAQLFRGLLRRLFRDDSGVLAPDHAQANVVGGSLSLTITKFGMIVNGTEVSTTQGAYFVWSDEDITLPWPGPSAQSRIDSLIMRIIDNEYGTITGVPRAEFEIVQGIPSGTPVQRPDSDFNVGGPFYQPGAWTRVCNVQVDTGDTTQLNQNRVFRKIFHLPPAGGISSFKDYSTLSAEFGLGDNYHGMVATDQVSNHLLLRHASGLLTQVGGKTLLGQSTQLANPPFNATSTFVAFTAAQWPSFDFVVPFTGKIKVTASAELINSNTSVSSCRLSFGLTGGYTLAPDFPRTLTSRGNEIGISRVFYLDLGVGSFRNVVTLTPHWYISSGTSADAKLHDGQIMVEALWT